jgi:hypothetical protein
MKAQRREYTDKDECKILQRSSVENQHRGGTICSTCQTQIQARLTNTKNNQSQNAKMRDEPDDLPF